MSALDGWSHAQARQRLATELGKIAEKRLTDLFLDPTGDDIARFPIMAAAVEALEQDRWNLHRRDAADRVLRRAISRLPIDSKPRYCNVTWRKAGEILFGLEKIEPGDGRKRASYKLDIVPALAAE